MYCVVVVVAEYVTEIQAVKILKFTGSAMNDLSGHQRHLIMKDVWKLLRKKGAAYNIDKRYVCNCRDAAWMCIHRGVSPLGVCSQGSQPLGCVFTGESAPWMFEWGSL